MGVRSMLKPWLKLTLVADLEKAKTYPRWFWSEARGGENPPKCGENMPTQEAFSRDSNREPADCEVNANHHVLCVAFPGIRHHKY